MQASSGLPAPDPMHGREFSRRILRAVDIMNRWLVKLCGLALVECRVEYESCAHQGNASLRQASVECPEPEGPARYPVGQLDFVEQRAELG